MRAATSHAETARPSAVTDLFNGAVAGRPGAGGQYFTTFDTAAGMLRDYAGYTVFPALRMLAAKSWTPAVTWDVLAQMGTGQAAFLGYCGFTEIKDFNARLLADTPDSDYEDYEDYKDDAVLALEALSAYSGFVNRVNAWVHHEFPWSVSSGFAYPDDGWAPAPPPEPNDPLPVEGARIALTWEPLGVTVHATLAENLNPTLCGALLDALPFTVLQDHSAVSGDSVFAWTPLVTTMATPVKERVCDAPVGRLRFQQATGQKLVVAYGRTTETGPAPVLGQIDDADLAALPEVGRAVFDSTFHTKNPIWLTVAFAG
jgi:hypothetical protein